MTVTEVLARAWIDCDPNRAGNGPGSGFHPDDIMETETDLNGKPRWHWFIPRAEALVVYLAERGFKVVES